MPRYDYKCPKCECAVEILHEACSDEFRRERMCKCGARLFRVFTVGCIKTNDSNPLKHVGRTFGMDTSSRQAVKQLERKGIVWTNQQDRDHTDRQRGKEAKRELREVLKEM